MVWPKNKRRPVFPRIFIQLFEAWILPAARVSFPREVVKKVGGEQKRGMIELSIPNSFGKFAKQAKA